MKSHKKQSAVTRSYIIMSSHLALTHISLMPSLIT